MSASTQKDIRCVFLDFGGVLAEEGFLGGLEAIAQGQDMDPRAFFEGVRAIIFQMGYVTGKADEAAFWETVRSRLGVQGSDEALRGEILSRFVLRPWMLDVVAALKAADLRVAILSDQVNWLAELDAELAFSAHVEKVFNSFEYGHTKNEHAFFNQALEELGLEPSQALLVDDAVVNVMTARQVGLSAILYTDREAFLERLAAMLPQVDLSAVGPEAA